MRMNIRLADSEQWVGQQFSWCLLQGDLNQGDCAKTKSVTSQNSKIYNPQMHSNSSRLKKCYL